MHCFIECMNDFSVRSSKLVVMAKVGLKAQILLTDLFLPLTCGPSADTTVDCILQTFRDDILSIVDAKECTSELRRQKVIAESTETDIERARSARKACGILFDHLCRHGTLEQMVFSRVLMEVDSGYGRMKNVGQRLHARIQKDGRSPVPVSCMGLAMLIALVGVAVCLPPLPFANDWQHRMCWNGIPWPWGWGQSGMSTVTAAGTYVCTGMHGMNRI